MLASYVHGGYIDDVVTMRRAVPLGGVPADWFFHSDEQASVSAVTNAAGALAERVVYDEAGAPTFVSPGGSASVASAIGNPYAFTGRRWDAGMGLYHYRMRAFDPSVGRFLQRDPIGIWGDAINLGNGYTYTGNNPWSYLDPWGLSAAECARRVRDWASSFGNDTNNVWLAGLSGSFSGAVDLGTSIFFLGEGTAEALVGYESTGEAGTKLTPMQRTGRFGGEVVEAVSAAVPALKAAQGLKAADRALDATRGLNRMVDGERAGARAVDEAGDLLDTVGDGAKRVDGVFKEVAPAKRASDTTVIGRYPDYALTADTYGFRRFDIPPDTWAKMSEAEQWAANQKYLDRAIEKGDQFLLSTPVEEADIGTFFRRELDYLEGKGYCMSEDGMTLVPGGN